MRSKDKRPQIGRYHLVHFLYRTDKLECDGKHLQVPRRGREIKAPRLVGLFYLAR